MRWWKILGLAGLAGVAASGALTVRDERRRQAYTPDEIRARLHERVAAAAAAEREAAIDRFADRAAGPGDDPALGDHHLPRLTSPAGRLADQLLPPPDGVGPDDAVGAGRGVARRGVARLRTAGQRARRRGAAAAGRYRQRVGRLRGRVAERFRGRRTHPTG